MNFAIAKAKIRAANGKVLTRISWYDTKLLIQNLGHNYFLPTSSQWDRAREYLYQNYPELELGFISGAYEWVDSLLAFPNKDEEYSSRLQISGIKKGKVPLLIEQSKVEVSGGGYILTDGKVTEVPLFPLKSGHIQEWDEDLGLPTKVGKCADQRFDGAYCWVDTSYDYNEGLRAFLRCIWPWPVRLWRFGSAARWAPSDSSRLVGFRLARTTSTQ